MKKSLPFFLFFFFLFIFFLLPFPDFIIIISLRYLHGHYPGSLNVHIEELNDFKGILMEDRKKYFIVMSDRGKLGPAVCLFPSVFFLLHSTVDTFCP